MEASIQLKSKERMHNVTSYIMAQEIKLYVLLSNITKYLLNESEVLTAKLRFKILPRKMFKFSTECSRLISCLLYGFLLWFCRPIIGQWALQENNGLE